MSILTSIKKPSQAQTSASKTSYLLALVIASSSVLTGITATTMTAQAAGLSDLFSSDKGAATSKFLPVDQAFQVTSSSTAHEKGTRLAINFDITPEHYVYKDQIKLTLPNGVTATAFQFSQAPRSIDDPTFGRVPVFDQSNMVATTLLTSTTGKSIDKAAVTIGWQGCAKAGLCYPPEKIKTTVNIAAAPQAGARKAATNPNNPQSTTQDNTNNNTNADTENSATNPAMSAVAEDGTNATPLTAGY